MGLIEGPGDVREVEIALADPGRVGGVALRGDLGLLPDARGLVIFAHGSGSSRLSRRNRFVAETIRAQGVATLLFDLLTGEEEVAEAETRHLRFDIGLLSRRLVKVVEWASHEKDTRELRIGCFGSSTGAAAALVAAAMRPALVHAVVSRGGRPDLAGEVVLREVRAPTLLIVGGDDVQVLDLNRGAYRALTCFKELFVVPGATHLFEEPGALEQVARLAAGFFRHHLGGRIVPPSDPTRP
jgi:putative phosphoribosyl transferase